MVMVTLPVLVVQTVEVDVMPAALLLWPAVTASAVTLLDGPPAGPVETGGTPLSMEVDVRVRGQTVVETATTEYSVETGQSLTLESQPSTVTYEVESTVEIDTAGNSLTMAM